VISIRRGRPDDLDFLFELVNHEDVEPYLGGRAALDRESLVAEIERSEAEPQDFGRFVIEVDGERAGVMGFEVANRRSQIAHLERLAVHPAFRGGRIADEAARLFQRLLFDELGYHRLQLEIYGFNERAMAHAERAGFVREGVKREAYLRHGDWVDGVMYGLLREDLQESISVGKSLQSELLRQHVERFNAGVRTTDWSPMLEGFEDTAEMEFRGVPVGPFHGKEAIAEAYRAQPPDDELRVLEERERGGRIEARYAWLAEPDVAAGELLMTQGDGLIRKLIITFERGVAWD
jgi:RimJ/RimL family protein N-acetyltransferase